MTLLYLILGTVFGFVLSRSGAADYGFIQGMFLFTEFQLYGILAVGVGLTAPGIWLIKRRVRTLFGRPVTIELKALHRGNVAGRLVFGVGWSLTGMCPGPILVNIGEGRCIRSPRLPCARRSGTAGVRSTLPSSDRSAAAAEGRDRRGLITSHRGTETQTQETHTLRLLSAARGMVR